MTRIKICGIQNLEEALAARTAGAWSIGEVFAPSSRQISVEKAASINHNLGSTILKTGVFVNEKIENLIYISRTAGLDIVQLHGEESPEYAAELDIQVIKSFPVIGEIDTDYISRWKVWAYLFDTSSPAAKGGTGKCFDWELLKEIADKRDFILAGGLNPENVSRAIQMLNPMAVDVSTGVEAPSGGKDPSKIRSFIHKVKEADLNVSR